MPAREDWIAVVEAGYRLDLRPQEWTRHIAESMRSIRDGGFGVLCYLFDIGDGRLDMQHASLAGVPQELGQRVIESLAVGPPDVFLPLFLHERPFGTISSIPGCEPILAFMDGNMAGVGMLDSYGLVARLDWETGLVLGINLPERVTPTARELQRLAALAAHLEAGTRIRRALADATNILDAPDVEAVLSPDAQILDARGPARDADAREVLRAAAKQIDRARGKLRHRDPDESLSLWQGLVEGTWSLVDHFDHDGRRFIVARRNPALMPDPRALTERESQVARQVSLGKTNAQVAYAMGLSEATVRNHLSAAMRKLGIHRRVDLVRMAVASTREAWIRVGAEHLLVRSTVVGDGELSVSITDAEKAVLAFVARGLTNAQIAEQRAVSDRTVANQIASLLEKFDVTSRSELVRVATHGFGECEASEASA